jgi:hypothetical protein
MDRDSPMARCSRIFVPLTGQSIEVRVKRVFPDRIKDHESDVGHTFY